MVNAMKVLYFAHIKHKLKKESDTFEVSSMSVEAFKAMLYEQYPEIKDETFQVAVNEEFVRDTDMIEPQDVVALIPPVSGG